MMPATPALDARLRVFAQLLGSGSPEDIEAAWDEQWATGDGKALHAVTPECVKAIVDFARMKAKGKIHGDAELGYLEMTGKAIAAAMARRAA